MAAAIKKRRSVKERGANSNCDVVLFFPFSGDIGQIFGTTPCRRITRPAARDRVGVSPVDTSRRKALAVHGFDENTGYLLGQRPVLGRGPPTQ
jgi:hypothetical protein